MQFPWTPALSRITPRSSAASITFRASSGAGSFVTGSATSSIASIAPEPAHVADRGPALLPREHPLADPVADDACAGDEALVLEHVEYRERRGLGDGVADVGAADRARVRAVHDLRAPDHPGEGKPGSDRLRDRDQVRLDLEVLHREHPAGAPEARLHLVGDEDDPVPVAERAKALDVRARSRNEATLAELRLEDDRRDVLRRDVRLEDALERCERLEGVGAAVRVRVGSPVDLGRERPHSCLVRVELRGQRERQQGAAVEAALERDHARTARVEPRELDGVLDRLGTGVEERGPGLAGDRDERAEALGELDVGLVRDDRVVGVQESTCLVDDGLDDPGVRVTRVDHADAPGEVDEDVPVDVRDGGVLGGGGEDREVRTQRRGDRPRLSLGEAPRLGPGHLGLDSDRPRDRHRRPSVSEGSR